MAIGSLFRPQQVRAGTYENGAFDPASGFVFPDDSQSMLSDELSRTDELALIAAAREELRMRRGKTVKQERKQELAEEVLSTDAVRSRLVEVFKRQPGGLHKVEVEYKNVTIEADALVGSSQNPTVWNAAKETIGKFIPFAGASLQKKRVTLLDSANGVIKPGKFTLLLGPPGSGKSIFLQMLSGRLRLHKGLRMSGDIKYNGEDMKDFVVQRTAGYVDQYDQHIPNMTVIETVNFASRCQVSEEDVVNLLAGLKEQLSIVRRRKNKDGSVRKGRMNEEQVREEVDHVFAELGSMSDVTGLSGTGDSRIDEEFLELLQSAVMAKAKPYITLHVLGLSNVVNTFVGDETLRGVSGGEKKRVTSAEVMVGSQWAIFMDEISTGLDSATTFSVINSLRDACHVFERTVVVSLLQPPPEVMELFDDLLLLTDGKVLYHGSLAGAIPFFSEIGFDCPVRKDPGSFLQEVTSPIGQMIYASPALLEAHGFTEADREFEKLMKNPPKDLLVGMNEIRQVFWESEQGRTMMDQLENHPFDRARGNPNSLARTQYARSGLLLSWFAFKRQILLMKRDRAYYIARVIQSVLMGLIISSFFASVAPPPPPANPEDTIAQGRKVLSLCVLSIIYLSMSSMPVLGFVFNTKGVFYKHRDNKFFPPWAFAVAHLISQIPSSTAESILFSVSVYFISGMTRTAGNFFIFLLVTWSCSNSLAGVFRLLAYVTPNMVRANALGSLILLLLMLTNGFTIIRTSIPDYLIWIYYGLNPLSYGVRALSINELTSPEWGAGGDVVLSAFALSSNRLWIWMAVLFNWVFLFGVTIVGSLALKYINPPPPQPSVSLDDTESQNKEGLDRYLRRKKLKKMVTRAGQSIKSALSSTEISMSPSKKKKMSSANTDQFEKVEPVPFTPISLVCRNVKYYVNDPSKGTRQDVVKGSDDKEIEGKLQLLQGIDFYAEPGKLTALMGGSGAGKTTLMDVVAGRKTQGIIRGDILANGRQIEPGVWSRVVGYVEQLDLHSPCITVCETLHFAARLRLSESSVSDSQVCAIVEETLSTIELKELRGRVVGNPGGEGLSIEQRKRLSIGVELVGNPSVLFMDEPTSGLDARAAAVVMRAVRNVASSNRTVTVTIHQPSMEIFEAFDMLVLLQKGGRLTYFGPLGENSETLISYLESYPGVPAIKPGYNPATWMLEVTGGSMATTFKAADIDFPLEYSKSTLEQQNLSNMEVLVQESLKSTTVLTIDQQYATSFGIQAKMLLRKYFAFYWRAPHYNFIRIIMTLTIALIYGLIYLNEGKAVRAGSEPASLSTVQNIMGLMFSLAIFNGMFNCMTVMPIIFAERSVFYRHKAASMYSARALALAQGMAEIPYLAAQAIVMVVLTYWMVGFQPIAWKFFYFLLMFFLSVTMYTFLGQCLVIICPNQLLAQLLAAFSNQMWTIFNGFLVPYPQTPAGWQWMSRISPTTWILYGLAGTQLADSDVPLDQPGASTVTIGEYVQAFWGYDPGFSWWCILIVFAYIVFFRAVAVIALTYISFNKR
ncbi:hypothetical protein M9434_000307 [Picochlorum sp. BPE23]|nr:hypothetical protein M9434_000307 [Picochlorum sp. BPE23]